MGSDPKPNVAQLITNVRFYFSEDSDLFELAEQIWKVEPAYRSFNGNDELRAQVALRDEHAHLFLRKRAHVPLTSKLPPVAKMVYASFNAANAEIQKHRLFLGKG